MATATLTNTWYTVLTSQATWIQVASWTVSGTGTLSGNTLVVGFSGGGTVTSIVNWWQYSGVQQARILKNGSVVLGPWNCSPADTTSSGPISVANGDIIEVQAYTSGTSGLSTYVSPTGTYVTVDASGYPIDSTRPATWNRTANVVPSQRVSSTGATAWSGSASVARTYAADATRPTTWSGSADLVPSQRIAADRPITWAGSASVVPAQKIDVARSTTWTGTAELNDKPGVDPSGTTTWAGAAALTRVRSVDPSGTTTWAGAVDLTRVRSADATGSTTWTETAALTPSQRIAVNRPTTWTGSADLLLRQYYDIDSSGTVTWSGAVDLAQGVSGYRPTTWSGTADLTPSGRLNAAGTTTWARTVDLALTRPGQPPEALADTVGPIDLTFHTADGRAVGEILCRSITGFSWARESGEVSTASVDISTPAESEILEDLRPWVHWMAMWQPGEGEPVWRGPIYGMDIGAETTQITARDPGAFLWRTRTPISRTFVDTDPTAIADQIWRATYELHGISGSPVILPTVTDTFTVTATAGADMAHAVIDQLGKLGLRWTVVSGRPVLGTFPREPIASLAECDFLVELRRRRDGSRTYNDVRLTGQNFAAVAVVPLAGLHLQTIVSADTLRGVANVEKAARASALESAVIRDELVVPAGASLHPQAPVSLGDLIPGKAFAVHTARASEVMRLDQMSVSGGPEGTDVRVTLVALEPLASDTVVAGESRL